MSRKRTPNRQEVNSRRERGELPKQKIEKTGMSVLAKKGIFRHKK
tara:strand:+ start:422 stop:556 length:135 start_codon:yes stop_codon:yes gene_type:complete